MSLGVGEELGNRLGRKVRIDLHHWWHAVHARDRGDIADEVVIELLIERGVDHIIRAHGEQRVAVRWRAHHDLSRDIAAGARPVLDDELLTEPLGEPLTYDARDDVDRLTSGKSDHHAHWSRGIGLCPRDPRHGGESGRARGQMHKLSAGKFHSRQSFLVGGFVPRRTLSTRSAARRNRSGKFARYDIRPAASTPSRAQRPRVASATGPAGHDDGQPYVPPFLILSPI